MINTSTSPECVAPRALTLDRYREIPLRGHGDLGDAARKEAWRTALVIPGSCELAMGQTEFRERTGGIGSHFWTDLARERAAAMADEAKERGELWRSTRDRAHAAS